MAARIARERAAVSALTFSSCIGAVVLALACSAAAEAPEKIQLDPFAQPTHGYRGCPETAPPLVTPEQMRIIAHERAERGTSCALEGTCEPGGAYRRDPEINERVRAAIAGDPRFADTSVWITTNRKYVTITGCVRSAAQRKALAAFVKAQTGVQRLFDETTIGTAPPRAPR
jgi:BON domain